MKSLIRIYKSGIHRGEEMILYGNESSGMVNFSGCMLSCKFCYTPETSKRNEGTDFTEEGFFKLLLELVQSGSKNINLITPSHLWSRIGPTLVEFKKITERQVPIVVKIGGSEPIRLLENMLETVDLFVTDFKIWNEKMAVSECLPSHYGMQTLQGIRFCSKNLGVEWDANARQMRKGVLVRHLLMPGYEQDSLDILDRLSEIDFRGPVNFMTRFIEPVHSNLIQYPKTSLKTILMKAQKLSFSTLIDGRKPA